MATKIRLKRFGKKRAPFYRVVVMDSRKARNGEAIEEIGLYHPTREPSVIEINSERALYWLSVGAQPSDAVAKLLELTGDLPKHRGDKDTDSKVKPQLPKLTPDEKIAKAADEAEKLKQVAAKKIQEEKAAAEAAAKAEAAEAAAAAKAEAEAAAKASPESAEAEAETAESTVDATEAPAEEALEAETATAPVETPVETSAEAPAEAPVEAPAEEA